MSFFFHLTYRQKDKDQFFWPGSTPVTWFSEKHLPSTFFLPSVQSVSQFTARTDWTRRAGGGRSPSRGHVSDSRGQVSDVTATVMAP